MPAPMYRVITWHQQLMLYQHLLTVTHPGMSKKQLIAFKDLRLSEVKDTELIRGGVRCTAQTCLPATKSTRQAFI